MLGMAALQGNELKAFSERFREIIETAGIDRSWGWQAKLAKTAGVGRKMIGVYLDGKSMPSIATGAKLARALKTSFNYLMAGQGPRSPDYAVNTKLLSFVASVVVQKWEQDGEEYSPDEFGEAVGQIYEFLMLDKSEVGRPEMPTARDIERLMTFTKRKDREESHHV